MLEPWALQQSRPKKRLACFLYQTSCLKGAACLRATSSLEARGIRQAGFTNPIALIPNAVEAPGDLTARAERDGERPRRALFLSRLHPKKGLLDLVEAWNRVRPQGWELVIAGPDEVGHLAEVELRVRVCGLADRISFPGEIWGHAKTKLYLQSDLFVLPSFSENFGLVVAEALGSGVPVITTRATPWAELEEWGCGWWIEPGVEALARALRTAVSLPQRTLREMGLRGRELIKTKYAWGTSARKMVEVYEWVLGRKEKPDCVLES
jgi:glycosyltransferase involved in cell wall biosynthesis